MWKPKFKGDKEKLTLILYGREGLSFSLLCSTYDLSKKKRSSAAKRRGVTKGPEKLKVKAREQKGKVLQKGVYFSIKGLKT